MNTACINLAIVDDHTLFRKVFKNYLNEQANLKVVADASNVYELVNNLKDRETDILLMDVFMPYLKGVDALNYVHDHFPQIRVMILSMSSDINLVNDLLDAGSYGYILKSAEPQELLLGIETVYKGHLFKNKILMESLCWSKENMIKMSPKAMTSSLTQREKRVLQLIWEDKSNKYIAESLYLGIRSVEKIRQDIKKKMGAKSLVGIIRFAIEQGVIIPDSNNIESRISCLEAESVDIKKTI